MCRGAGVKAYLLEVGGYLIAVALYAAPAALPLYACQVFLLPAFGMMWVGLDVVLAFCVALVGLITLVRCACTIRMD